MLAVDELGKSLYPALFKDPGRNPRQAQLLFTSHDTTLLGTRDGTPVLDRGEVWLTEKDRDGATALYPVTDFSPRKSENLQTNVSHTPQAPVASPNVAPAAYLGLMDYLPLTRSAPFEEFPAAEMEVLFPGAAACRCAAG